MSRQQIETYGLSRSPILANFQKIPNILSNYYNSKRKLPMFISVHYGRNLRMKIGRCTYKKQDNQQETLKVE
jgi:hypothetical protein